MESYKEKAIENHKAFCSCSWSILKAFLDLTDLDPEKAKVQAEQMARGKMGQCGALLAAELVLKRLDPLYAPQKIEKLEEKFLQSGKGSIYCQDLIGSCRSCVADAAGILEEMIQEEI